MTRPIVVGLGSHHGDDQAGWLVLNRLQERGYPIEKLMRLRHPADLLDVMEAGQALVICDTCAGVADSSSAGHPTCQDGGGFGTDVGSRPTCKLNSALLEEGGPVLAGAVPKPIIPSSNDRRQRFRSGTIHVFRWPTDQLLYSRYSGSHDLSLSDVMEIGLRLGCIPDATDIWAIEGEKWDAGTTPSDRVQSAAVRAADAIWEGQQDA